MRIPSPSWSIGTLLAGCIALLPLSLAQNLIQSESLETCQDNSGFSASLFSVVFTPNNDSLAFNIVGISTITGNVTAEIDVSAYGYSFYQKPLDPCSLNLNGLCPLASGQITIKSNVIIPADIVTQIPGIAYAIPDLDGTVQIKIFDRVSGAQLACVQAHLSNGKTVYQKGVGWASAVIAGLALVISAFVSGLGHSNTAAHVAANALSLFGFFQAQAIFGMAAVPLPPIVASWTQNFQWSMGIIRAGFIQDIASWYQQATGGTPSNILGTLSTTSVNVQKRSLETLNHATSRAAHYIRSNDMLSDIALRTTQIARRTNINNQNAETLKTITVRGIERVGFRAGIELTNIFLTGYIFFVIFVGAVVIAVVAFKFILEGLARWHRIKGDTFQDFRNGWTTILKGILFRIVLIGFPQMVILCFWELTVRDSGGEIALAIITVATMIITLTWACSKVWRLATRSIDLHKNPAYILYSDPVSLHKWGFLYVQFKATAFWFIVPTLLFVLAVGMFIAFAQGSYIVQAIALLILDLGFLIAVCIIRPYMSTATNVFNGAIAVVNFISAIFLLFFTEIFGLPGLVVGVMGVIFFILNAACALVLLVFVLVVSLIAIFSKNPDVRYQPMRDDRGSFIKSQTNLNTELDALGATARGETKASFRPRDIDADSYTTSSLNERQNSGAGYNQMSAPYGREGSGFYQNTAYDGSPFASHALQSERAPSVRSNLSNNRSQHTASPWQRGAGYDR